MPSKPAPEEITLREFARRTGRSHGACNKARLEGRITARPGPRGEWLVVQEVAEREWARNTDTRKQRAKGANGAVPEVASLSRSLAVIRSIDARMRHLDLEERQKNLFRADEALQAWDAAGRAIRDALLAVPDRTCDLLAALSDPIEIKRVLRQEISAALQRLSNGLPRN